MGEIKVNFEKVYNQGEKYKTSSEELKTIKANLQSIEEGIKEAWNNDENVNFIAQYEDCVNYLDEFINFLDGKGELLKKMSGFHEDSEKEFINQMERSDLKNEYNC
jgi:uncharacterized protein YukE